MKIAIIGNWNEQLLAEVMEQLITESQCYLFTVVCGGTDENAIVQTVGYRWAKKNGAPIELLRDEDIDKLITRLVNKIDFVVAANDNSSIVKRIIMKMSMCGKHGKVVNI